ncbi:hypothetical protein JCM16138_18350 [Thermococcus atlanticus]
MRFKGILLLMVLMSGMMAVHVFAYPLISVQAMRDNFEVRPGDTIIIPVRITNLGNESISNVTLYVTGPASGFKYQTRTIKTLPANQSTLETLIVRVLSPDAGTYSLKVVASAGSSFAQDTVSVRVLAEIDYSLAINVSDKYSYGSDVVAKLLVNSTSNTPIIGTISFYLYQNKRIIKSYSSTVYIGSRDSWKYRLFLPKPEPGKYTLVLKANFYGNSKMINRSFEVYQRILRYRAEFRDGAVVVTVTDGNGNAVPGINVQINGIQFTTDSYGRVSYAVDKPGTYRVKLNLDGKTVETLVEVKKLFIRTVQQNETLLVHVLEPTGRGVGNVSLRATGPLGTVYAITNSSGWAEIKLGDTGFGTILLTAENPFYLPARETVQAEKPAPPETRTESPATSTTSTMMPAPPAPPAGRTNMPYIALIILFAALIFAGTSYMAFFMPVKLEEQLDKYYFVKIKAPKLRGLKNFRYEKIINATDARATKGTVQIEGNTVVWEIGELEPDEEAFLQVLL